jgi:hypothetical protein
VGGAVLESTVQIPRRKFGMEEINEEEKAALLNMLISKGHDGV